MLNSKISSDGEADSVSARGIWHRVFSAAKSVLLPIRKRFIESADVNDAERVRLVPLPKAGAAPEVCACPPTCGFISDGTDTAEDRGVGHLVITLYALLIS